MAFGVVMLARQWHSVGALQLPTLMLLVILASSLWVLDLRLRRKVRSLFQGYQGKNRTETARCKGRRQGSAPADLAAERRGRRAVAAHSPLAQREHVRMVRQSLDRLQRGGRPGTVGAGNEKAQGQHTRGGKSEALAGCPRPAKCRPWRNQGARDQATAASTSLRRPRRGRSNRRSGRSGPDGRHRQCSPMRGT